MDISEAKKISIVDYLENMGYSHAKIRRGQYWSAHHCGKRKRHRL